MKIIGSSFIFSSLLRLTFPSNRSGKGKNVSYTLAHGFSVFASGENPPDEMCYCLFDSTSTSKWLDFGFVETEASFIEVGESALFLLFFGVSLTDLVYQTTVQHSKSARDLQDTK